MSTEVSEWKPKVNVKLKSKKDVYSWSNVGCLGIQSINAQGPLCSLSLSMSLVLARSFYKFLGWNCKQKNSAVEDRLVQHGISNLISPKVAQVQIWGSGFDGDYDLLLFQNLHIRTPNWGLQYVSM